MKIIFVVWQIFTLFLITVLTSSCGPTYQQFYNSHKNDLSSTSFQMPRFMVNILSGLSSEVNSFFNDVNDFSYITLNNVDQAKWQVLSEEINAITNSRYTDILRKTEIEYKTIISSKEVHGVVKELIYFEYKDNTVNSFSLKANFDSNQIEKLLQYQPSITPNSIQ